jgi:hypothetical protein
LDRNTLLVGGILLAICASGYLFLHGKKDLVKIEQSIAGRLGFLEESIS